MNIVWASSRVLGSDLCSTSQINLANGLVDRGYNVTFFSPGKISGSKFKHSQIQQSKIRGFHARSIRKNLITRIEDFNKADIVLLDWTLWKLSRQISKLRKAFRNRSDMALYRIGLMALKMKVKEI